jgi:hypothetical protein
MPPEDIGKAAADALLAQIGQGGCIDDHVQPLVFALMLMCPEDVSRVRVGRVSPAGVSTLRLIRDVWGVTFKLKTEEQAPAPVVSSGKKRKAAAEDGEEGDGDGGIGDASKGRVNSKKRRADMETVQAITPLTAELGGGYSAPSTVVVTCLGIGFKNFSKKVT